MTSPATYDQANRLVRYEIYRDLGLDRALQTAFGITLSLFSERPTPAARVALCVP